MAVCDPGLSDGYACELAYSSVNFEIIIYFVLKKEESIFLLKLSFEEFMFDNSPLLLTRGGMFYDVHFC